MWAEAYGFPPGKGEGWAGPRERFYVEKFRTEPDSKDRFHPGKCQNLEEWRVIEFILPILSPKKSKSLSITMANTMFGAMSEVRPINWGG